MPTARCLKLANPTTAYTPDPGKVPPTSPGSGAETIGLQTHPRRLQINAVVYLHASYTQAYKLYAWLGLASDCFVTKEVH